VQCLRLHRSLINGDIRLDEQNKGKERPAAIGRDTTGLQAGRDFLESVWREVERACATQGRPGAGCARADLAHGIDYALI